MKTFQDYTGADATLEILIMLFVAFLLGALLMWLYDKYMVECVDEEYHEEENRADIVETEPVKEEKIVEEPKVEVKEDDLKIIEGVGPKIESILKSSGLTTLKDVANTSPEKIREILLEKGGERYAFHNPATWPDQADLADTGRMEELKEYQDFLSGGVKI